MARTAIETATVLRNLHSEKFGGDYIEPFRLTWEQLRGIAGIDRLTEDYLAEVSEKLLEKDYALLTFNNSFIVAKEGDFSETRTLTARLTERYLADTDDQDDLEFPDDDE